MAMYPLTSQDVYPSIVSEIFVALSRISLSVCSLIVSYCSSTRCLTFFSFGMPQSATTFNHPMNSIIPGLQILLTDMFFFADEVADVFVECLLNKETGFGESGH
jgi:hypothetical protein